MLSAAARAVLHNKPALLRAASSILHEMPCCGLQQHWQPSVLHGFALLVIILLAGLPYLCATCSCVAQQQGRHAGPLQGTLHVSDTALNFEKAAVAGGARSCWPQ